MRTMLAATAASLAVVWLAPGDAYAQSRGVREKRAKAQVERVARRAASVGPNGLCQRDTGTATSRLDLRKRCDVEEFWARIEEQGSTGGPD